MPESVRPADGPPQCDKRLALRVSSPAFAILSAPLLLNFSGNVLQQKGLHFVCPGDATQKWPKPLLKLRGNEWPPILCAEHIVRRRSDVGHWGIQPSQRDLRDRQFDPGSRLPGYSRISLRQAETVRMSKLQSRSETGAPPAMIEALLIGADSCCKPRLACASVVLRDTEPQSMAIPMRLFSISRLNKQAPGEAVWLKPDACNGRAAGLPRQADKIRNQHENQRKTIGQKTENSGQRSEDQERSKGRG